MALRWRGLVEINFLSSSIASPSDFCTLSAAGNPLVSLRIEDADDDGSRVTVADRNQCFLSFSKHNCRAQCSRRSRTGTERGASWLSWRPCAGNLDEARTWPQRSHHQALLVSMVVGKCFRVFTAVIKKALKVPNCKHARLR